MASNQTRIGWRRRLRELMDAGVDVMARYPYDTTEVRRNPDFVDPPDSPDWPGNDRPGHSQPPAPRTPHRPIRIVTPPAPRREEERAPVLPGRRN